MRKLISALLFATLLCFCLAASAHEMFVAKNADGLVTKRLIVYETPVGKFFSLTAYAYDGPKASDMARYAPCLSVGGVFEEAAASELQVCGASLRGEPDGAGNAQTKKLNSYRVNVPFQWEMMNLILKPAEKSDGELAAEIRSFLRDVYCPADATELPVPMNPYAAAALVRQIGEDKSGFDLRPGVAWGCDLVAAQDDKFISKVSAPDRLWYILMQDSIYTVYVDGRLETAYRLNPDLSLTKLF